MARVKAQGESSETGHLFIDRASLPNHVRAEIRRACRSLKLKSLGSHGFRKLNAQSPFASLHLQETEGEAALRRISQHLGHNRIRDTKESFVPPQDKT